MRIGINLLSCKSYTRNSGLVTYIQNLLRAFGKIDKEDEFYIFTRKEIPSDLQFSYKNFHYIETPINSYCRQRKRIFYEQMIFPFLLSRYKIEVLFNPNIWGGPQFWFGKKITVLLDCALNRLEYFDSLYTKIHYKIIAFLNTKLSHKIVTISKFSKKEIAHFYKVPDEKIKVTYLATPELKKSKNLQLESKKILQKFNIKSPYFLYIGITGLRKNTLNLLKSFQIFNQKNKNIDLVLAGEIDVDPKYNVKELVRKLNIEENVILARYVTDKEKIVLYTNSLALLFPSLYEGFGLPVLEAQSLGVPVLTSNVSALPEVAGDAALYVNPYDIQDIAQGIEKLARDGNLCQELIEKGFENIKRFSWEKTAKETLKVLKEVI
jgi:glycosyltransferase involved in cell wall biosynthesis